MEQLKQHKKTDKQTDRENIKTKKYDNNSKTHIKIQKTNKQRNS